MASENDTAEVKSMIEAFYKFANVPIRFQLNVNEDVAAIFGAMLSETKKCSAAFAWIPEPPRGIPSISWLASQLGKGMYKHYQHKLSFVCARQAISVYSYQMQEASAGLAMGKAPKWA